MDEFQLIRRIARVLRRPGPPDPRVVLGIGDDAAVLAPAAGRVVATTDTLVEGVHFRLDLCSAADAGWRAAAANLSDLAAMGARPLALLVGLQFPPGLDDAVVLAIARGLAAACRQPGVEVAGGNLCCAPGPLAIAVTALGEADRWLTRSGARPGDEVWAGGPLGSAALGLRLLRDHPGLARSFPGLVRAWRRPVAQVGLGMRLAVLPGVTAAIDVSDGLLQDLGHVLEASGVGAAVDASAVPLAAEAVRFAMRAGLDPLEAALAGGDDYVLVACATPGIASRMEAAGMRRIGRITRRRGLGLRRDGRRVPLPGRRGWLHRRDGDGPVTGGG